MKAGRTRILTKICSSVQIYAISDFHLPGGTDKPMDIFGAHWEGHFEQIAADWQEKVLPQDIILIPGDISWAITLEEAIPDLNRIGALPGKKILVRGNHDYWWNSISRLRSVLPEGMYALQNDALLLDDVVFCGTRGWLLSDKQDPQDEKIYQRELQRLEMSLNCAQRIGPDKRKVVLIHYPPVDTSGVDSAFSELLERFQVHDVVYGHIHGAGTKTAFQGEKNGVRYHFVSCDGLSFKLYQLPTVDI